MDIFRRHIFQINLIDFRTVIHIIGHPRRRGNIIHRQLRRPFQFRTMNGCAGQPMSRRHAPTLCIDFPYFLNDLKQPRPSGNTIGLQGRRNRKTDGFLCPAGICNDQIHRHRVQPALDRFYRSIEGFQINGYIGRFFHDSELSPL